MYSAARTVIVYGVDKTLTASKTVDILVVMKVYKWRVYHDQTMI